MASIDLTLFGEDQPSGEQETQEEKEILSLPRGRGWVSKYCYLFEGFWCATPRIKAIISFQNHFQAKDSDVIVASLPKSGTTWLKALTFAIVNRQHFSSFFENHPLLTSNPHELVPFFEFNIYVDKDPGVQLSNMKEPRLFSTHVPFLSLAKSVKESNCKIIYICRNPFDIFVSSWIFFNKIGLDMSLPELTKEEAFESYCKGMSPFGPFWDHMLGYFKESIDRPNQVLFLKYEDLKEDGTFHIKRIADFLDCPFTKEEESNEVIGNIVNLCGFEKMKEIEVSNSETFKWNIKFEPKDLFRKAKIGDWTNHFSPSMIEKLSKIIKEKLSGSDLSFKSIP